MFPVSHGASGNHLAVAALRPEEAVVCQRDGGK